MLAGISMPTFVLGELLLAYIYVPLNTHGIGWINTGYAGAVSQGFGAWSGAMILPWITLATVQAAVYTRLSRGSLLDTLGEDYIRTARAKGLTERRVDLPARAAGRPDAGGITARRRHRRCSAA